ncbi:MAG: lytic transglycosylase domain-containing protein [Anaerolineales bacterium]
MMPGAKRTPTSRHRGGARRRRRFAFLAAPLSIVLLAVPVLGATLKATAETETGVTPRTRGNPISGVFTPEIQLWGSALMDWAHEADVDPNLAAAVMQIESCGNPFARSTAGAMGLFQVMPYHFAATEDPFSPSANALRALDYLKHSLAAAQGDPRLAFAGYNGGISVISQPEESWPPETKRYVYWTSGVYEDAISGAHSSGRLAEWLAAGGASLCQSARDVLNSD